MLLDTPRQSDLLSDLGTCGRSELDLGKVTLDREYTATGRRRADIDEEELVLDEFGDFCLLLVLRLDTEQSAKQEQRDLKFCNRAQHVSIAATSK